MDRSILSAARLGAEPLRLLTLPGERGQRAEPERQALARKTARALSSRMDRIVTLKERKAAEADRRRGAVRDLRSALAAYAREHGGRFLLFGSAARGDMRYHSDVDILTDFPEPETNGAWNFAERACWDRKLDPDIGPRSRCKAEFIAHIQPDIEVIG
jgi:hypothetical protein